MSAPDLIETADGVTLGAARHIIAVEVALELEALCLLMRNEFEPDCEVDARALRGLVFRILVLSRAAISALTDGNDEIADIARRVGFRIPQEGEA